MHNAWQKTLVLTLVWFATSAENKFRAQRYWHNISIASDLQSKVPPCECQILCEADAACVSWQSKGDGVCRLRLKYRRGASAAEATKKEQVLLVTFADGPRFEATQKLLHKSLRVAEIDRHLKWNSDTIPEELRIPDQSRLKAQGRGRRYLWKPHILWESFREARWGDWIIYQDASQYIGEGFSTSVRPLLAWLEAQKESNPCQCIPAVMLRQDMQHEWEQTCVSSIEGDRASRLHSFCEAVRYVERPNMSKERCQILWRRPMLQYAWMVWRKNTINARVLREFRLLSERRELISHMPFNDQTLFSLVVNRISSEVGLRVLWAPSLYIEAWRHEMDIAQGGFGSNDATIFKHLNFMLEELYRQRKHPAGPTSLQFVRPGMQPPSSVPGMLWRARFVSEKTWRRSLCIQSATRPRLAATLVSAKVSFVDPETKEAISRFPRYKAPVGWQNPMDNQDKPRSPPPEVTDFTEAIGEELLFSRGLSGVVSLGRWEHDGFSSSFVHVIADLLFINDGQSDWPKRSMLRFLPDTSYTENVPPNGVVCLTRESVTFSNKTCGPVRCQEHATAIVTVPLITSRDRKCQLQPLSWSLQDMESGLRFGTLLQAHVCI